MDDEIKDGEELNAKDLNDANEAPADGKGEEHSDPTRPSARISRNWKQID